MLEFMKYRECANVNCCPIGQVPSRFPLQLAALVLPFSWVDFKEAMGVISRIDVSELPTIAASYRAGMRRLRSPEILRQELFNWAYRLTSFMNLKSTFNFLMPARLHPRRLAERCFAKVLQKATVRGGPFSGMSYSKESVGSVYLPKLLGIYEQELHGAISSAIDLRPNVVIDVGAAEGYYAVGMATQCRLSRIISYESEEQGRKLTTDMAEMNGVLKQMDIRGYCGNQDFLDVLSLHQPELIIMDVEGAEFDLLNHQSLGLLKRTRLLVETHPWVGSRTNEALHELFAPSHNIETIHSEERTLDDLHLPWLAKFIFSRWLLQMIGEGRPCRMTWLVMTPRSVVN